MTSKRRRGPGGMGRAPVEFLLLLALASLGAGYEWGGPAARAIQQLRAGKSREAVSSFEEARRERPASSAVRYDQALAFAAAGMADSASAAYRDARDLQGAAGRAAAAYNEGNAAYRQGKIEDAIADYRAALREDPKRADAKRNLEEALRRARESRQAPLSGSGGTQGDGSGGTGQRQGGSTPPPPGAANAPNDSKSDSKSKDRPSLGAPAPNREEAEHWLDALEAERRAGRSREQAAKRAASREGSVDRDW
ncbi:MAG TPA: tetratricopeptide repeat protein [Candidatus Eisenbacteria bacterium]|nr:tetratricopeptide repeat protein [Candidatus Eisenbacteria bacterium]